MKTAFFIVLLANLTLWMYERHRVALEQAAEVKTLDTATLREAIVLAGEPGDGPPEATQTALTVTDPNQGQLQKSTTAAELATQPAVQKNPVACYEVGPFAKEQLFKAWSKAVKQIHGEVKGVTHNEQQIIGYLVLYPTTSSLTDVKASMQTLRKQGIDDAYPLVTGEHKGSISLGAFALESRAQQLQKELQGRGVEAVVKPRFKDTMQQYALVTGIGTDADRLRELGQQYRTIRIRALPDADPNCLESGSGQSSHPLPEVAENAAKRSSLSRQSMQSMQSGTDGGPASAAEALSASENTPVEGGSAGH